VPHKHSQETVPWYEPEVVNNYESWYEGNRADELEKCLLLKMIEQFDSAKSIIEIGCGTTHFTRWLASLGYETAGVDVSPPMIREAKTRWPNGRVLIASSSNLPLESNSFDLAMSVTSLEFMSEPAVVLREAARVARQGIILGLLNTWSFLALRRKLMMLFGAKDDYFNAHFYSILELKRIAKVFGKNATLNWRTTIFPAILHLHDTGNPFGDFLAVAIVKNIRT
jgi:ubiquinone/menaquinone biosynthesis C-methylase UbiE